MRLFYWCQLMHNLGSTINRDELFCAIVQTPFGAVGIRTGDALLRELVYLPPGFAAVPAQNALNGRFHPGAALMKPQSIVVLGGTGFVGHHLVPRLQRDGHCITLLSRNREQHRELGVLPRVAVVNADVHDHAALTRHLAGADAAINLVGILNERGSDGRGFRKAHVELTENLIAACAAAHVPRLLQMSSLRAGEGDSHYLATRGEADARVQASELAWTIFRPSVIFGPGDGLFFRFARLLRMAPVLPLARAHAKFAPVYVGDVAEAFARALIHPHTIGRIYELAGPRAIELREVVRWTARMIGKRRLVIGLPDALGLVPSGTEPAGRIVATTCERAAVPAGAVLTSWKVAMPEARTDPAKPRTAVKATSGVRQRRITASLLLERCPMSRILGSSRRASRPRQSGAARSEHVRRQRHDILWTLDL